MPETKKILFSAFDIGGGNAIFPVANKILKDKKFSSLFLIGGPSKEIFKNKKIKYIDPDLFSDSDLKKIVIDFKPDFFVSGTSAGLTFDKKILDELKKIGAKTIYILDYWANYWQRFSTGKKDFQYLPDIICVMDEKAKSEMISEGFDPRVISVTGNPHFDFFRNIKGKNKEEKSTILFVSTPISDKKNSGYDEFTVLDGILSTLKSGNFPADFKVIIRPHPKENIKKFKDYAGQNVEVDDNSPIEKLISKAGLIIGMTSVVLFQSAISGKKVISYQPNLKTKDFSMSEKFGLGNLAVKDADLLELIKKYFSGKFPKFKKDSYIIIPHATENVINIIKNYDGHEKK